MAIKDPYLYDDSGGDYGTDKSNRRLSKQASDLTAQMIADRAPDVAKVRAAKALSKMAKRAPRRASIEDSYDPNLDPNAQVGVTARAIQGLDGMDFQNADRGKTFKNGGKVKSASSRADGIAQRGKTRGKIY